MPHREQTAAPPTAPIVTGYFRETPGYSTWRRHGTADYLLILTLGGAGRFGHAGGFVVTNPGDATLLRPGTLHDYAVARGADGWELLWAHFLPRPHWLEWMRWPEEAPGLLRLSLGESGVGRPRVEDALWSMHRYATGGLSRRTDLAMNALEEALLWCEEANPLAERAAGGGTDPRVRRAMEMLLGSLSESIPLADVAQSVGVSASRLAHLFKEQTGRTPGQFVEGERIARAKQLLTLTSRTVAAVAGEVGFENPFYFTLRFKKHTGLSPRDWRQREQRRTAVGAAVAGAPPPE